MEVRRHVVAPWSMNAYALVCTATGQSVLIDPGGEADALQALLAGTTPVAILITHTHPDHIGALGEMRARLRVPVLAHPGPHHRGLALAVDRPLADGDGLAIGQSRLRVEHTPGHSPDMLSVIVEGEDHIIVGDTLFDGGPGKTWSSDDFQTTLRTLREVVLQWPDAAQIFPGHGPSFRLGDRRTAIEGFLTRDHGDFSGDATWEMGSQSERGAN
jgi:glyoxylase-like metal-dependent hydrolase (beta-lactamase superfamily II)